MRSTHRRPIERNSRISLFLPGGKHQPCRLPRYKKILANGHGTRRKKKEKKIRTFHPGRDSFGQLRFSSTRIHHHRSPRRIVKQTSGRAQRARTMRTPKLWRRWCTLLPPKDPLIRRAAARRAYFHRGSSHGIAKTRRGNRSIRIGHSCNNKCAVWPLPQDRIDLFSVAFTSR